MARFRVPHTLILLLAICVVALLLTWILPQGQFEREAADHGRERVVPGSFQTVEGGDRLDSWFVFQAIPKGFMGAADIIFFLFIIGGCFEVLRATGAIDALLAFLLKFLGTRPFLLIAGGIFVFAAGSASIGMAEEYIPFVPLLLALCIGLGFDAVTAIGILCVGYGVGYGAALVNPFTVIVAQGIAEVPPSSGWEFRSFAFVLFVALGIQHVWSYARKVKADPSASLVAGIEPDPAWKVREDAELGRGDVLNLLLVVFAIVFFVWGIQAHGWYLEEMGAIFLGLTVLLALVSRMHPDDVAKKFCHGAADLTTTALLIGFARSIQVILEEGQVIDTIVHGVSMPLQTAGPAMAAVGMFFFQSLCNLFIPSGSGQAFVTMPLMAPLADLVGIHRQVAVLAYQLGDGLTNILVPTNAVLIGILTMAKIPYEKWLRFIIPFMIKAWILGSLVLATAVFIGWTGVSA
ncbi:MAG: AbgT family transporter [Thermoanaerobaculia bacterium]|nr:AbgT family transporter [Thermoanaerobaculia bacterium]